VGVRREYDGWPEGGELDRQAAALLAYLDRLADERPEVPVEPVAHIDEHGVVTATIALHGGAQLYVQVGDGWDRVLWTCPSGRVHEWTWRDEESPDDVDALLAGRGIERETLLGTRRLGAELLVGDRRLAATEGQLRLALVRLLGIRPRFKERPAR
jgi:hypothetical protein